MQRRKKGKKKAVRKHEEPVEKVPTVAERREQVQKDVELSIKQRRFDRKALETARYEAATSIRLKEIKDAQKVRGEKAMSEVTA